MCRLKRLGANYQRVTTLIQWSSWNEKTTWLDLSAPYSGVLWRGGGGGGGELQQAASVQLLSRPILVALSQVLDEALNRFDQAENRLKDREGYRIDRLVCA